MDSNLIGHIGDLVLAVDGLLGLLRRRNLSMLDLFLVWPGVQGFFEGAFEDLDSSLEKNAFVECPLGHGLTFMTQCALAWSWITLPLPGLQTSISYN